MNSGSKKSNIKLFWLSALAVVLIFGAYRIVLMLAENQKIPSVCFSVMMWAYMLVGCGLFLAVVVLQHGFSGKPLLPDDLPSSMSAVEKTAAMEDDARRKKRAKYLMIPLVAIVFVFLYEIIEIYYFPAIANWFSSF